MNEKKIVIIAVSVLVGLCVVLAAIGVLSVVVGTDSEPTEITSTPQQIAEPTEEFTRTPLPTNTPEPTVLPTEVSTETPIASSDAQAEYFEEVVVGSSIMTNSLENMGELFLDPQLSDVAWYYDVTAEVSMLLASAMSMEAVPVPDNCDVCRDVHNELAITLDHANVVSLNWTDWLEDQSEIAHLDSMAVHIVEIGDSATRIVSIMESYIE